MVHSKLIRRWQREPGFRLRGLAWMFIDERETMKSDEAKKHMLDAARMAPGKFVQISSDMILAAFGETKKSETKGEKTDGNKSEKPGG